MVRVFVQWGEGRVLGTDYPTATTWDWRDGKLRLHRVVQPYRVVPREEPPTLELVAEIRESFVVLVEYVDVTDNDESPSTPTVPGATLAA